VVETDLSGFKARYYFILEVSVRLDLKIKSYAYFPQKPRHFKAKVNIYFFLAGLENGGGVILSALD